MEGSQKFGPRAERHRVQVIGRLIVEKGGGERGTCLCNTLNMSLSGALVEASSPIEVGSVLNYAFSLPGVKSLIEVTGEVIRKGGPISSASMLLRIAAWNSATCLVSSARFVARASLSLARRAFSSARELISSTASRLPS